MLFHPSKPRARPVNGSRIPSPSQSRSSITSRLSSSSPMDALVTLHRRLSRDSPNSAQQPDEDTVSMSNAGQRILPAVFKLVPVSQHTSRPTVSPSPKQPFLQAGGHNGSFSNHGHTLVKHVTDREASFYEAAEEGAWPSSLLPKYYGRVKGGKAIKIENLTYGFDKPCVIDLKMGVQTVEDDESSLLKRLKMSALDIVTHSKSAGCRLEGLSMYRTLEETKIKGSKVQSHSISADVRVSLQDVLTFFLTDESGVRTDIALRFQRLVENILTQFQQNDKFRFIGSSILLIYNNDNRAPYMRWVRALRKLHKIRPDLHLKEDQISGLTRRTRVDVRMIDFAHTGPLPEGMIRDEGYIRGLHTIINALKAIRAYRAKPIFSLASAVVDVMEESRAQAMSESAGEGNSSDKFTFSTLLAELTPLSTSDVSEAEVDSEKTAKSSPSCT